MGLRVFDAAIGGLGGCPYAPGASGNVATEAVHEWLTGMGWQTGLDRKVLAQAVQMVQNMRHERGRDV
jgi:hydroxymethylglutaryl-CoA lyase